jgi:hypothetical protein
MGSFRGAFEPNSFRQAPKGRVMGTLLETIELQVIHDVHLEIPFSPDRVFQGSISGMKIRFRQ